MDAQIAHVRTKRLRSGREHVTGKSLHGPYRVAPARNWSKKLTAGLAALVLVAGCAKDGGTGAEGQDFFAGKTITLTVPSSVGGGTDRAARMLADFLAKNVPGGPEVRVENVEAASLPTVINDWNNRLPDDGTQIMMTPTSGHLPWLLGDPIVEYDLSKMQLLWANGSGHALVVRGDSGIEEAADLQNPPKELIHGGGAPTDASLLTILGLEVLGVTDNMKHIFGYGSSADEVIAFQSGETNVVAPNPSSLRAKHQSLIDDGTMVVAYTHGRVRESSSDQVTVREPMFPEVPTVEELYREWNGSAPSGPAWDAFVLATSIAGDMGHAAWLQEDAPAEAVEVLRSTIAGFTTDPEYIARHEAELGAPADPTVGPELKALTDRLASVDPNTMEWIRGWLSDKWGAQL